MTATERDRERERERGGGSRFPRGAVAPRRKATVRCLCLWLPASSVRFGLPETHGFLLPWSRYQLRAGGPVAEPGDTYSWRHSCFDPPFIKTQWAYCRGPAPPPSPRLWGNRFSGDISDRLPVFWLPQDPDHSSWLWQLEHTCFQNSVLDTWNYWVVLAGILL